MRTFYEFFAGGGMARAGLGAGWRCAFANDFDPKKARCYRENWGSGELWLGDVGAVSAADVPGCADLAWASFPCQDLSLAGAGDGLAGRRSGAFWPFWRLITDLSADNRRPRAIVLENVCGLLTSRDGQDFETLCRALTVERYRVGALVIDAKQFLPQSRPRLFIVGLSDACAWQAVSNAAPDLAWHTRALREAVARQPDFLRERWLWLTPPRPVSAPSSLGALLEDDGAVAWHSAEATKSLVAMMSAKNRNKLDMALKGHEQVIGTLYKRTRIEAGRRIQRAEIRFDGVAGCLRTPGGGSSRQTVIKVSGGSIRTRLLSARESARLMGLSDNYKLPANYNDAYHLTGDGLAVPVVEHLARFVLEQAIDSQPSCIEAVVD